METPSISLVEMPQQFASRGGLTFYVRRSKTDNPTMVYATFYIRGEKHHIGVGVKVRPSQWDRDKQEAMVKTTYSQIDNYNNRIANAKLSGLKFGFYNKNSYLCNSLSDIFNELTKFKTPKSSSMRLKTNGKILDSEANRLMVTQLMRNKARENTKGRSFNTECGKIDRFKKFLKNKRIADSFENMTFETITQFNKWLNSKSTDLSLSTADQTLRCIKKYLKMLGAEPPNGYNFDATGISSIKSPKDTRSIKDIHDNYVALTHTQIEQIANLEIGNDKALSNCRDLFLIQCYSGVRISDMHQFLDTGNYKSVNGEPYVVFVPKKTNKKCFKEANIPLSALYPQLSDLYEKHKGKTYTFLPNDEDEQGDQSYNNAIKQLGSMCGWTQTFSKRVFKGGVARKESVAFYKRLSSHVGRHSFVTNAVREFQMELTDLIRITGHKNTEQITSTYLNLQSGEDAILLDKALKGRKIGVDSQSSATVAVPTEAIVKEGSPSVNALVDYVDSVDEAKRVLNFLGADADDYMELDDIQMLIRMIVHYEDRIVRGCANCEQLESIKKIFNDEATLKQRREHLHNYAESLKRVASIG
ncbi:MAG: site-specific integrase [[Clostridium] fimetarium]|nr:site-specific integrase [Alistipes timonensis]MCM1405868.1 site-specific integrase [[Clostridium] fimetarium]